VWNGSLSYCTDDAGDDDDDDDDDDDHMAVRKERGRSAVAFACIAMWLYPSRSLVGLHAAASPQ